MRFRLLLHLLFVAAVATFCLLALSGKVRHNDKRGKEPSWGGYAFVLVFVLLSAIPSARHLARSVGGRRAERGYRFGVSRDHVATLAPIVCDGPCLLQVQVKKTYCRLLLRQTATGRRNHDGEGRGYVQTLNGNNRQERNREWLFTIEDVGVSTWELQIEPVTWDVPQHRSFRLTRRRDHEQRGSTWMHVRLAVWGGGHAHQLPAGVAAITSGQDEVASSTAVAERLQNITE